MIALQSIVHHGTVLQVLIMIIHVLWQLSFIPPYVLPQIIHSAYVLDLPVPTAGEEEAADGGEEETGVKVRMEKVDGLKVVLDGGRHMIVDTTEGGYSGEILGSLDVGVNIEDREGPLFLQARIYLVLQVLLDRLNAHSLSREEFGENGEDEAATLVTASDLEDVQLLEGMVLLHRCAQRHCVDA